MKPILFLLTILLPLSAQANPNLDWGKLRPDETAYYIQDLHTGQVLAEHRADTSLNPASTMKLLTAYAALNALGSDHRWTTEWHSPAPIHDGILHGDLYWIGSGDPSFDQDHLIAMQQQLHTQGIHHIQGRLILDRSRLPHIHQAAGFEHDGEAAFTTPPDPHMIAYKVTWLTLNPPSSDPTLSPIRTNPPLHLPIDHSRLNWQNGRCRGLRHHLNLHHNPQTDQLILEGDVPQSCIGQTTFVNLFDAPRFAYESFRGHWQQQGRQGPQNFIQGTTPNNSRPLARHHSPPLADILRDMNKHSNNLIARSVFLQLGQHNHHPNGAEVLIRRQLAAARIDDEALILENGSGLSRRERATARLLGQMLHHAYHSPWRDPFINSLPIAGRDGTLRSRFTHLGSPLRLKTGTLRDVRALAGYWLPTNGRHLAIVILINSPRASELLPSLDALTTQLIQQNHPNPSPDLAHTPTKTD